MIADYKLRDAAAEALLRGIEQGLAEGEAKGQAEEQTRIVQMLESYETGISPEQLQLIIKELTNKK